MIRELHTIARNALSALRHRRLFVAVSLLVGGTGLAAVIVAATLPIVTRFYTPVDFGILAAMTGLVSILSVSASLRFDIAIPLPESDEDGLNLLAVAMLCAIAVTILACMLIAVAGESLLSLVGQKKVVPFMWLLPLGIFAVSSNIALQSWFIRNKDFVFVARNRVIQAAVASALQIYLGFFGHGTIGLIMGPIFGFFLASAILLYRLFIRHSVLLRSLSRARMVTVFRRYDRFPKFSAIEALANTTSIQVPILIIAAFAPAAEAGYLLLAMTVIQAPMGLLGSAIAQVFLSHAPAEFRAGQLDSFTTKILSGLVKTGVGPLVFGGILAPELFGDVFGSDWWRAGVLLAWMTPWFVMQYLASPISMTMHVIGRQPMALAVQLFGVTLRVPTVYAALFATSAPFSEVYALSGFVFYAVYLAVILHAAQVSPRTMLSETAKALPIIGTWIALALFVLYATG